MSDPSISVFTPSNTPPEHLEFILVQRRAILEDAVERVRESALTGHKHHLLFVGPRGCGKTHLITLIVHRVGLDGTLVDRLRIAWLNEDETCTTLLEFLLKIHAALQKRYPAEFNDSMLAPAFEMKADAALEFVSSHVLEALGSRTLMVAAENLDAIFENLGDVGQKQLRAFIQENPKLTIVATAQRLVESLSDRANPFYGFFQTEHLKPLNVEDATELLKNIALLRENGKVVEFLNTRRGRSRVRALHHLSGGNHRIYIVLSQFITRDSVDALVAPFMKMVDELTPYYQERIRWLPPLQRRIVEFLCSCETTVPVKEIAKRLFSTSQTISSQLQGLREKGYIEASQRGRESLYEISEPMMRICVEVKENQRLKPLRLLVDFLRVWYDDHELGLRLGQCGQATASKAHLESAIERNRTEGNLLRKILVDDFLSSLPEGIGQEKREDFAKQCSGLPEAAVTALKHFAEGNPTEAVSCLDEEILATTEISQKALLLNSLAGLHSVMGDRQGQIIDHTAVIELSGAPIDQLAIALLGRGVTLGQTGDSQGEINDYTTLIELPGAPVGHVATALLIRGLRFVQTGNISSAISNCTAVIELAKVQVDHVAMALVTRGMALGQTGDRQGEISDFTTVIGLSGAPVDQVAMAFVCRGMALSQIEDSNGAINDFTAAIGLSEAPVIQVAMALVNRGMMLGHSGDIQGAIHDYTAVINLPGAPVDQVTNAFYCRGVNLFQIQQKSEAQTDFESAIHLKEAPPQRVVDAFLALSQLHWSEAKWDEGFRAVDSGLECGKREQPPYLGTADSLIGVLFLGGLNPETRSFKVTELFGVYQKNGALPVLGDGLVKHLGAVFRAGAPFPSSDNLKSWVTAWNQAAADVDEFRLPLRLLRTGIEFVIAGGKDKGILLDLTSPERNILNQTFGLTE